MKSWTVWAISVVGIALALATAYGAYTLAGYSWNQVVDYKTPYAEMDVETAADGREPMAVAAPDVAAHRVVLVVIDGLPTATAFEMPSIAALAERGARVDVTISQPSLSFPGWTNIVTGASPQISGVTTNYQDTKVPVESIFDSLAAEGKTLGVVGSSDMDMLYGVNALTSRTVLEPWPTHDRYATGDWVNAAIAMELDSRPDFLYVHIPDIDNIGHEFGGDSRQWDDTAAAVDADLARFFNAVDDGSTTFVVLPDHGRIAAGGHGGWEPETINTWAIFAGPGVAPSGGSRPSVPLEDIAPTVSILAGVRTPAFASGTAISEVLAAGADTALALEAQRNVAFAEAYANVVNADRDYATGAASSYDSPADYIEAVTDSRLTAERWGRLPLALGIVGAALAITVGLAVLLGAPLAAVLSGALTYVIAYNAAFFGIHGYLWSLSAFNEESMVDAFMNGRLMDAAMAGVLGVVVAAVVFALVSRKSGEAARPSLGRYFGVGITTAWAMIATLALQIGWFLWWWGAEITWVLPDFKWAFKYDLDLVQATALGAAALVGPVVAIAIGWAARRVQSRA